MQSLILYGVPFSQPVRAVMWLMLFKRLPFELVMINPGSKGDNGSRNPNYLAKNPGGTIPTIEEPATGFTLGEAHAIMTYLSRVHGWTDVYPSDEQQRARVDQYLHYHHRNVRETSLGLVAPKIRKDLDIPEIIQAGARRTVTNALRTLEEYFLSDNRFIIGDELTLADFAAYSELGQAQPQFTNVYDLSAFPNVQRWMGQMTKVPYHDEVHTALAEMGDISEEAPDKETIVNANKAAFKALSNALSEISN
ncbi:MAG TPA: hypothetical protein DEQ32_09750 [Gammaproteobacteria bacterium]|jgi:glutathione S-transferase|nr:hypothetical protein [Gammaproteobacteria bacterium]